MPVGHVEATQSLSQVDTFGSIPWTPLHGLDLMSCIKRYPWSSCAQPQAFFQHDGKKCGGGLDRSGSCGCMFISTVFRDFWKENIRKGDPKFDIYIII